MGNTTPHKAYSSEKDGYDYAVTFEQEPFAKGASRYAFLGKLESNGPDNGKKIVTKVFIDGTRKGYDQWTSDLTASKKAEKYAEKFNIVACNYNIGTAKISFIIPILLKVSETAAFNLFYIFPISRDEKYVARNDWVAVENYIEGEYVKFNNNYGDEKRELSQLPLAFCHWTWEISGYHFMICDLQGVESSAGCYQLTDPVVHSAEQIYGDTDLGVHGMEEVMKGHRCNWYCKQLKLKPNPVPYYSYKGASSKVYRFTLTAEQQLMNKKKKSKYFQPLLDIQE